MRKRALVSALVMILAAGFFALTAVTPSFAASQANKAGVDFSMSGQYLGIGEWAQNQDQSFVNLSGYPTNNTYQAFVQRLRMNSSISYDKLAHGMPLAALFLQFDLTNAYNGITDGYGTNGYYMLGGNPAPTGFNNDFNTFGIRQAYIRVITPIGAIMFGRMPVKFGLGVAVNTNADGLGDFLPMGNIGVFVGTLFGSEVSAYATPNCTTTVGALSVPSNNCTLSGTTEGYYPPAVAGYTHIQMGTIPTIEVMTMKPINDVSYSAWLTEAHLNQFEASISSATTAYNGSTSGYTLATSVGSVQPTANITFGGVSAKYSDNGMKLAGEFDYFRGSIVASSQAISMGYGSAILPVFTTSGVQKNKINSYDLYVTGSKLLDTSTPVKLGLKFGMGAPVANGDYNFTYYSTVQNTRTLFGDVIGSSWQPIQFSAPGNNYIYGGAAGEEVGPNLSNKWVLMLDASEYFSGNNKLQESLIHAQWLKTSVSCSGNFNGLYGSMLGTSYACPANGNAQLFGGSVIGTELDLNFTHHFTKTLSWEAWGSYVITGSGVESPVLTSTGHQLPTGAYIYTASFDNSSHKNMAALGTDIEWNF